MSSSSELISVVIPVYNTGQCLQRCVDSVLNQDYPNMEIILVDDGSNDGQTSILCDSFSAKYRNVVTYHKSNGGSASARNYGIHQSHGSYIGFVDSDDSIEPDMYSALYDDVVSNGVKVAIGGITTEQNGRLIDRLGPVPSGIYDNYNLMRLFMLGNFHSSCTNLYHKSLFDKLLFPENEVNEDYMLNYWIFRDIEAVSVNEKVFYHYIRREGSNTGSAASLKFVDWIKHTSLILSETQSRTELLNEAEYQYLFSNIVLANKSLLTLGRQVSEEAEELYSISTGNLSQNRDMLKRNLSLTKRYRFMGFMMSYAPRIYKLSVISALRIKTTLQGCH